MENLMKNGIWMVFLASFSGLLIGCSGISATTSDGQETPTPQIGASASGYSSDILSDSYEGALPVSNQLALGTLELEGTENAVSPQQAKELLPLWRALQADALQSDAETNAVLKQIERAMTPEQLAAIAAMQFTIEDMGAMQEEGNPMTPPVDAPGGRSMGDLTEEQRAAMRATVEAGGQGGPPAGGFGQRSEEERAVLRATAEAGGMALPGPAGGGWGQRNFLAQQVVALLAQRAGDQ
jgi:hypothetical protein